MNEMSGMNEWNVCSIFSFYLIWVSNVPFIQSHNCKKNKNEVEFSSFNEAWCFMPM